MGFGKAQKIKRNIEKKEAEIKADFDKTNEYIDPMDDAKRYRVSFAGTPALGGALMPGAYWKRIKEDYK